jgi:hypothetical protein
MNMQHMTIDDIPTEIFQYILNFNSYWDLIHANYVSKSWQAKLAPRFDQLKMIYTKLIKQNAETIIEECLKSTNATQATFISNKLLKKLTLEQVVIISCSSYEHAEIVFKSMLFHDKPKQVLPNQDGNDPFNSTNLTMFFDSIKSYELYYSSDIFEHFIPSLLYDDLSSQIKKLTHPDLLGEELGELYLNNAIGRHGAKSTRTSSHITNKFACQAYIARAVAEKDYTTIKLVDIHARRALTPNQITIISKLSLDHAKAILNTRAAKQTLKEDQIVSIAKFSLTHARIILDAAALKNKLSYQVMGKISLINADYKSMIIGYVINLLCILPIQLANGNPHLVKMIALSLIKDNFFKSSNPVWRDWLEKKPEISKHILEVKKMLNHNVTVGCILIKLIGLSIEHAKEILSIPNIGNLLNRNALKSLASKDQDYNLLIDNFLLQKQEPGLNKKFNI